jgi:sugar fermentation stimulation protein A
MKSSTATPLGKVRWRFALPLVPGKLIRRYKRFLADVELESGAVITAHCPNSGSMLGCMKDGAPVYLSPQDKPGRRTTHTWEMVRMGRSWIGINTMLPNKLALEAARLQALDLFADCDEYRGEVKVSDHSRIDLWAKGPGGEMFVEVKNVTLAADGLARFPRCQNHPRGQALGGTYQTEEAGCGCGHALYCAAPRCRGVCPG